MSNIRDSYRVVGGDENKISMANQTQINFIGADENFKYKGQNRDELFHIIKKKIATVSMVEEL